MDVDGLGNVVVAGRTKSRTLVTQKNAGGAVSDSCYSSYIPFLFGADVDGNVVWEYYFTSLSSSNSSLFASTYAGNDAYAFDRILYVVYPRDSLAVAADRGILTPYFVVYL